MVLSVSLQLFPGFLSENLQQQWVQFCFMSTIIVGLILTSKVEDVVCNKRVWSAATEARWYFFMLGWRGTAVVCVLCPLNVVMALLWSVFLSPAGGVGPSVPSTSERAQRLYGSSGDQTGSAKDCHRGALRRNSNYLLVFVLKGEKSQFTASSRRQQRTLYSLHWAPN